MNLNKTIGHTSSSSAIFTTVLINEHVVSKLVACLDFSSSLRIKIEMTNKKNQRSIDDILLFREDISPFLVHLTRDMLDDNNKVKESAKTTLKKIISKKRLEIGNPRVSDARFGLSWNKLLKGYGWKDCILSEEEMVSFFSAICFTETPINEIHCLLEISRRQVQLKPYGLVFLKERLQKQGVSPVLYLNNEKDDKDKVFQAICSLIRAYPREAAEFLPLIAVFGNRITAPNADKQHGHVDFRWEREWRLPASQSPLSFDADDVFIGLCPHTEIEEMESLFPSVGFIDPTRNMKWYASKLIDSRKRCELKHSVV
jgi:hypothetical protein